MTGADWLADYMLAKEVFGPLVLIIRVQDAAEMEAIASSMQGQLTSTLYLDDGDTTQGHRRLPILDRKAGRILSNGFSTGVEVADIDARRHRPGQHQLWCNLGRYPVDPPLARPIYYQNLPAALLPEDLG